ncbi:hypothetical protein ACIQI8_27545 [Streptomyces sp. NPDC092369]|uniref:hypothetical protein n=1 Tax=Streptomyces sp. NPDC092369 TaxID=3366015 RepID=UPI0038077588
MTTPPQDADGFTEIVDAHIPRVDLVDKAANGTRFLIAKQQAGERGLFSPEYVRTLLAKSDTPPAADEELVTMTASPAAIAKMIHGAAVRAEPAAPDQVSKDTAEASSPGDLDPTVALAEPEETAPGDPNVPGSPAWEAVDAATATKWTAILARARRALDVLVERELLEPAAGCPDDYDNVMDLGDGACAIDYAISLLAPFAVAEQADALTRDDRLAAVGKALADWDAAPLDTIEALTQVRKAGRVLSQANENAIRGAVDSLQKVLASLPAAPPAPDDEPVTKQETTMTTPTTSSATDTVAAAGTQTSPQAADGVTKTEAPQASTAPAPAVAVQAPVEKAKDPQVAVYDKQGKLVGIVDSGDITMIADAEPETPATPDAPAAPEAPETTDLTPAPAAEVGTPSDAVEDDDIAKTTPTPQNASGTDDLLKRSDVETMIKAALDEQRAGQTELLTQQGEKIGELTKSVESLTGLVKTLEEQPAPPRVFTQGAGPQPTALRGQDRGAPVAVAQDTQLKKSLYGAADAGAQNKIATDMQELAIAQLSQIHQGNAS